MIDAELRALERRWRDGDISRQEYDEALRRCGFGWDDERNAWRNTISVAGPNAARPVGPRRRDVRPSAGRQEPPTRAAAASLTVVIALAALVMGLVGIPERNVTLWIVAATALSSVAMASLAAIAARRRPRGPSGPMPVGADG